MMQKILVTGGAGFIGSHLATALLERGHSVHVIDNLSTGELENIHHLLKHPRFSISVKGIEDSVHLFPHIESADLVFHLAAGVGVERILNAPISTIETNIQGTSLVLKASSQFAKRLILVSTSEVYGHNPKQPFAEDEWHVLGPAKGPRWGYACSKLLSDYLAFAYYREQRLPVTIVRLFNTVGPRQSMAYGMVIPRFMSQALLGQPITVYGDGSQRRCFLHVADAVRALILLAETETSIGEVFNVGSTQEISILELAQKILSLIHRTCSVLPEKTDPSLEYPGQTTSGPLVFLPENSLYGGRFEDMYRRLPNISKIQKYTGWKPLYQLDTILRDVLMAMRDDWLVPTKSNEAMK